MIRGMRSGDDVSDVFWVDNVNMIGGLGRVVVRERVCAQRWDWREEEDGWSVDGAGGIENVT